jgi:hypothetical protein
VSHRVGKNGKFTKREGYTSDKNTWVDADEKLEEIPTIVHDYLSTIDKDEIFSDPHLRKYYNKMIGYSYRKAALGTTCSKNKSDTGDDVGIAADITNQTTLDHSHHVAIETIVTWRTTCKKKTQACAKKENIVMERCAGNARHNLMKKLMEM